MEFAQLAATSAAVAVTAARKRKIALLAGALRGLSPEETVPGTAYLAGELRQRQIGVGWASLRDLPPPAEVPTLTVAGVDAALQAVGDLSGPGSQQAKRDAVAALFGRATADEQAFLRGLLTGEVRQGALTGVLTDAVALAAGRPVADVRRALLLAGDLRQVAAEALHGDLGTIRLAVGRPLAPMLASPASDVADALGRISPAAVEPKLDGIRIQAHRDGDDVAVFSRSLDDLTARVPEVVAVVRSLHVRSVILDGEGLGLADSGRPLPFQDTVRKGGVLLPYFFDVLHHDGDDLVDEPAAWRFGVLDALVPDGHRVGRTIVDTPEEAGQAFRAALDAGQEGVVVKDLTSGYDAGRRGGAWLKVKPRHTLDLVVLAAEWGHGRRQGWLSNLHLGARDPEGGFVMLGKTFKGMTDEVLRWQTERLRALATDETEWVVHVRPELVVEIAFDGVQRSTRYPGGVALRFARVLRYREDKRPADADTIEAVRALSP
ncbi:putative DNA ligase [Longispora fulva]|uniref:DNA ligase n=1 Tax=Longispora fulva TaxID=619741 RepID=A0A8J7GES3_9ACTN|nr:ATP-dependent DNA ligase [Longispora fulva]MBG6137409.1 DNA ligase-1 [Longispora fulva]GIG61236.1 putative DNA ligase [Longispora fulva]